MKLLNIFSCCSAKRHQQRLHKKLSKSLTLNIEQQQQLEQLLSRWQQARDAYQQHVAFSTLLQTTDFEQAAAQQLETNTHLAQQFSEALIAFKQQLSEAQQSQLNNCANAYRSSSCCQPCSI